MKLLIVGLDGATHTKVLKYHCPFLQGLCNEYQNGIMLSDDPHSFNEQQMPWTGPAWNTVYTAVDAKAHGVTSDKWAAGETATLKAKVPTIFEILNKEYRLGIMSMPALFPSALPIERINGWAITGFPASGQLKENWKYPEDLEVPEDFSLEGFFRIHEEVDSYISKMQVIEKLELTKKLFGKYKTEVGAVGIQYLDFIDHSTYDMNDPYEFIDQELRLLFENTQPDSFLICSDHGFKMHDSYHSQYGFYVCSLPGEYRERSTFDMAPLALWVLKRLEK